MLPQMNSSHHESDFTLSEDQETQAGNEENQRLVWKETVAVKRAKLLVFASIAVAAIVGAVITAVLVQQEESTDFEKDFKSYAKEIAKVSEYSATKSYRTIRSLSKSLTSYSVRNNVSFPFVTMPHFEILGGEARDISGAEVVVLAPLIKDSEKKDWEVYATKKQGWIKEGLAHQGLISEEPGLIPEQIYSYKDEHNHKEGEVHVPKAYLPVWQIASAPNNASIVNLDLLTRSSFEHLVVDAKMNNKAILSDICDFSYLTEYSVPQQEEVANPQSHIFQPVYETFEDNASIVAFVIAILPWNSYFLNLLPESVNGINVVIDDTCGDIHTYEINGPAAKYLGKGDYHDRTFDDLKHSSDFAAFARFEGTHPMDATKSYDEKFKGTSKGHCKYVMDIYPTTVTQSNYKSNKYLIYAFVVVVIFFVILILLLIYDWMVIRRQRKLLTTAEKTHSIVSSLFPENFQERIMAEAEKDPEELGNKSKLKNFLGSEENERNSATYFKSKPIADFFPEATIMFADLVGFTAWSSTREPSQVFSLLESIFHAFDEIAKHRRIFKVETVGDCYVAVAGLPDPRKDHAVAMARFANECLARFNNETKQLEVVLGPDTADLRVRLGLHSGPVTAGVLRGERSRFQLFGDTMNTASRMESTGHPNKIHISQDTAELLIAAGKEKWLSARSEAVVAKGKGEMKTYWLELGHLNRATSASESIDRKEEVSNHAGSLFIGEKKIGQQSDGNVMIEEMPYISAKTQRLVVWVTERMSQLLKQIITRRRYSGTIGPSDPAEIQLLERQSLNRHREEGTMVLDEAAEIISLPKFHKADETKSDPTSIDLDDNVTSQLHMFVQTIAAMYRDNPFHNFEHASHVTMSVHKLLSRIVAPDLEHVDDRYEDAAMSLHDHTYGITSDPLTQFAVVLSALIHDVDHEGVPNATHVKEKTAIALTYKNKSIVEQNSVDLAWDLLVSGDEYSDLRNVIYTTPSEFKRFRQLVVNSIMATDILDKEARNFRQDRWNIAFSEGSRVSNDDDHVNRKATIVIEHLIQASDVAHTMQHWHIYTKWNERLFHEMYKAYKSGRSEKDPAERWYEGELGFFDFYILPLAKKLKSCGVFGVSSDEYLNYAQNNRREWEQKGKKKITRYIENYEMTDF